MFPTTRRIGLTFAFICLTAPAEAQTPRDLQNFREVFLNLDANNDTVLDRGEVPEKGRDAFDRLLKRGDTNKDGRLEAAELQSLGARLRALGDPRATAERFRAVDADDDGKISREEFPGPPEQFERLDADKDGFLTRQEARRAGPGVATPPNGAAPGTAPMQRRLAAMDRDGDNRVTRDEFNGPAALFDRLDTDNDGALTKADRPAAPTLPPAPGNDLPARAARMLRQLQTMDKDGDGKVSREEFNGPAALFDRLDLNKDGALSRDDRREAKSSDDQARPKP